MLDSTNTKEGWIITNNFFDSAPKAIDTIGGAFFIFSNNVIDHVAAGGTAILMRSSATLPSIGHRICHNQIFFDGAGAEGIRLLNNTSSTQNHGNVLDGNEIFYYSGASLSYGIYIDGTSETHNRVLNNSIFASTRDCYNVGTNSIFTGNKWLNGGFNTTQLCEYDNNHGSSASSRSLTKQTFCEVTRYYSSTMPVSGSYVQGDFVENINNSIDGNNMRLTGWYRATTGSGHVLGTDWFAQYVSTVSPAT